MVTYTVGLSPNTTRPLESLIGPNGMLDAWTYPQDDAVGLKIVCRDRRTRKELQRGYIRRALSAYIEQAGSTLGLLDIEQR